MTVQELIDFLSEADLDSEVRFAEVLNEEATSFGWPVHSMIHGDPNRPIVLTNEREE